MSFFDIFRVKKIKAQNDQLSQQVLQLEAKLASLGFTEHEQAKNALDALIVI